MLSRDQKAVQRRIGSDDLVVKLACLRMIAQRIGHQGGLQRKQFSCPGGTAELAQRGHRLGLAPAPDLAPGRQDRRQITIRTMGGRGGQADFSRPIAAGDEIIQQQHEIRQRRVARIGGNDMRHLQRPDEIATRDR